MNKRLFVNNSWIFRFTFVIIFSLFLANSAFSGHDDNDPHMTGLTELTQEEIEWQKKHVMHVKKVKLNKLGLKRVNRSRKKIGLDELTEKEANVVTLGKEIEGEIGAPPVSDKTKKPGEKEISSLALPSYVDNSNLKFFPPIRSQGSLPSCGCFSGTYYTMTYMYALAHDLDAKSGGDDYCFSPKWTYNMINNGEQNGSWYFSAYYIGQKHGVATWAEFPYDSDYRAWCLNRDVWENAIYRRFDQCGYVANTHLDSGIEQVKALLLNGYILNIPTYIYSWQYKSISNDPSTSEDDPFVGKRCCFWVNGTAGYHAMTVVGYNDYIWVDINGNNSVDDGEKGAFRIANSWGTGWQERGFCWMAYDALRNPSAVRGGPSTGRVYGWSPPNADWVTALTDYNPMLIAEFTVSHVKRNQLSITLGVSDIQDNTPNIIWYPKMIYRDGGPYAFDGTTMECEGTFVFDFTDLVLSGENEKRYYLGMEDTTTGDIATLYDCKLIDLFNGNIETGCADLPITADGEQRYAYLNYNFNTGNILPVASVVANPISGMVPFNVTFSGADSYDPDGEIIQYDWDFADGVLGIGEAVEHTYMAPGIYKATLRVKDNMGGIDEDSITIEVNATSSNIIHIEQIDMSIITLRGGNPVQALVRVEDLYGSPVEGAVVSGEWGGILSGLESSISDSNGIATFTSKKTKKTGIITFSVTDVSANGYAYDMDQNTETNDSIIMN